MYYDTFSLALKPNNNTENFYIYTNIVCKALIGPCGLYTIDFGLEKWTKERDTTEINREKDV